MNGPRRLPLALLAAVLVLLAWSGVRPHDYATWALEVFPAVAGIIALAVTYRRFPFTPLAYWLMAAHMAILIVGGHYTYSLVPAGEWLKDALDLSRNHYDRLGHFAQGFVPAIVAREVLVRNRVVARRGWLGFIVVSICGAISAVYELIEWVVGTIAPGDAVAFLAMQGDVWDTQKDMALCIIAAVLALVTLSRVHDRQIARLAAGVRGGPAREPVSSSRPPAP